jgi:hypothetical protein
MFKLAAVALPIDANPYNLNPPMQEHSWCLRERGLFIYCIYSKTSMTWAHIAGRLNPDLDPEARDKRPQYL